MYYVFTTTRFLFPSYFAFIFMFLFVTASETSYFTNRLPTKFKVFIIMKTCRATMSAPRAFRCRPSLPKNPPLQGLNSTSQYLTLLTPHISFSLLFTSTLLLSNASLRSILGKIPITTTSPNLSSFILSIISSYFLIIFSVSSMRRLFVPTCTITVSSLPLFSISGTICSILPPGLYTVLSPAHCCCRFLPTCLTRESPTNSTLPFLCLVTAFSCFRSWTTLSESFVVLLLHLIISRIVTLVWPPKGLRNRLVARGRKVCAPLI